MDKFFNLMTFLGWMGEARTKRSSLVNRDFSSPFRNQLNDQLQEIQVGSPQERMLIDHYIDMNRYCDYRGITLLEDEAEFFTREFQPGRSIDISDLLQRENNLFASNAHYFSQDSLDYQARINRIPQEILQYIPGQINIQNL